MERVFIVLASLSGGIAVMLGAFGAHALRDRITPGLLETFKTGVSYQIYHALALLGVALLFSRLPSSQLLGVSGWLFVAGTVLFSGSLYVLVFTGIRWIGAITPFGGVAFIAAWLVLALAFARS